MSESTTLKVDSQEAALWQSLGEGGERASAARAALFDAYLPLARRIAARHKAEIEGGDIEYADLAQYAYAGLLEAIDRFDPGRGAPFAAFARKRITGSVIDGVAKTSELREQISHRARMRRERIRSLVAADIDSLEDEEAMQALVDVAAGLAIGFLLEESALVAGEQTPDRRPSAYESAAWKETVGRIAETLDTIEQREKMIIRLNYYDGLSFEQIGAVLGISKGRISQLHRKTLEQLRKRLGHCGVFRVQG